MYVINIVKLKNKLSSYSIQEIEKNPNKGGDAEQPF